MGIFHQSNYFLFLPNIQVHRVIHALYQKHRSRDSILLALGESLHKSSQPSKIREHSDECVFCFLGGVFFTFESMHMIYEYWASGKNTFISSSKCQTQKQLGLHRRSALVILNVIRIERGSKLERNERLGEERQLEWACIWKRGRQSMIEDGVRGLAKQPWCNLSSCSWSFAASSRQSLFSLTSLLPPVQ